ncbi:putative calcium-activated potassium channel subunit beta-3-like [Scophthalmus maximus]|uniref:Putative calcium-activated potassium channel subunit beta-3-like n=1 Tax=Scophthalmus maximus TaxID=52904 RepID=A0A2U9BL54_SCOMX|nr:putative calcium-activated potassium channel subunit beta-3-like [Scophthalmus maximus]
MFMIKILFESRFRSLTVRHHTVSVTDKILVSSVGEDRAILLGFTMMAFSVLMFFVVGITVVKPFINSHWEEEAGCVLVQADILTEWVDCRGVSTVPCLRAAVNFTGSNQSAFLHLDEESVLLAPECFYVPKCQMDRVDLQAEVHRVKEVLDTQLGSTSSCFIDRTRHPGVVLLSRKYTLKKALLALLWPCLTLGGGALLVGLVKLTQCLARLSAEMCSEGAGSRLTSRNAQGKLYRLLRRSSMQTPS